MDTSYRRVQAPALAMTPYTFELDSFHGPLEVLLALVQRREVDVYRIQLLEILKQYSKARAERPRMEVDLSAEMLALSATLLLIKCRALLAHTPEEDILDSFLLPSAELLENLVNYCHFKAISEQLAAREAQAQIHFTRPPQALPPPPERPALEPVPAEELHVIFRQLVAKAATERQKIQDETWRLPDVIRDLSQRLQTDQRIPLMNLIPPASSRGAIIVLFLALLELLKRGQARVERESSSTSPIYWLTHQQHETSNRSSYRRGRPTEELSQANN
jgi:segregation and condensation protein A